MYSAKMMGGWGKKKKALRYDKTQTAGTTSEFRLGHSKPPVMFHDRMCVVTIAQGVVLTVSKTPTVLELQ